MRFRKLRIAFSVTCGSVCVLLIMLWVRSYRHIDLFTAALSGSTTLRFYSGPAGIGVQWKNLSAAFGIGYHSITIPLDSVVDFRIAIPHGISRLFQFRINSEHIGVSFLYAVLFVGSLAVLPWIRAFSWQFSLRTLLIATTLVAVALGFAVWAAKG